MPFLNDPARLVFLDESGFNTAMTRSYARAPSDQRAMGTVPRQHGKNHTLICALNSAGPLAPLVIDGSLTGISFEYYVAHQLCPLLTPNQVVIMDNLPVHHRASIRTLIEAKGCHLLFLSPYSPDFNPVELLFSKIKAIMRGAAWRTVDALINGIALALNAVSATDIQHWFKHTQPLLLF